MSFSNDLADLMSWGSLFHAKTAATIKAWSPIEKRLVAGMINRDDMSVFIDRK